MPKYLKRYQQVAQNKAPAHFNLTRKVKTDFHPTDPIHTLWEAHQEASQQERGQPEETGKQEETDTGKTLLDLKAAIAQRMLESCNFCDHHCQVNRFKAVGVCQVPAVSRYSAEFLHLGEEPELIPSHTVFFTGCNFACVYCQNWQISTQPETGTPLLPEEFSRLVTLRRLEGARNLNLVTPTPHTHTILKILQHLRVNTPIVWNCNMYYSRETALLLEGIVDVYLADFRYGNNKCAERYSHVRGYWETVTRNFQQAYQDGEILLRHLVLPGHLECCTRPIIEWTARNIPHVRFNLMFQYRPEYQAYRYPELARPLTLEEKRGAIKMLKDSGLDDLLI